MCQIFDIYCTLYTFNIITIVTPPVIKVNKSFLSLFLYFLRPFCCISCNLIPWTPRASKWNFREDKSFLQSAVNAACSGMNWGVEKDDENKNGHRTKIARWARVRLWILWSRLTSSVSLWCTDNATLPYGRSYRAATASFASWVSLGSLATYASAVSCVITSLLRPWPLRLVLLFYVALTYLNGVNRRFPGTNCNAGCLWFVPPFSAYLVCQLLLLLLCC